MKELELREIVLRTLKLLDAPKSEQDIALAEVEAIANERFALALPEILSVDQLKAIEKMNNENREDAEIDKWIEEQIPDYQSMMEDIIQDVAEEAASAI